MKPVTVAHLHKAIVETPEIKDPKPGTPKTGRYALGWGWVRNPWLRYLHLGAIAFVAAEALLGMMCQLTVWEDALRGGAGGESFVGRWVRYFLYYEAPAWVFTIAYVGWAVATLITFRLIPPRLTRAAPS